MLRNPIKWAYLHLEVVLVALGLAVGAFFVGWAAMALFDFLVRVM